MYDYPHRRHNLLTGEWVLVSPHRTKRPWHGAVEAVQNTLKPHDSECQLCPGNKRINGVRNPDYKDTFVFTNDFQAIYPLDHEPISPDTALLKSIPVTGTCKVVCFSPRHNTTLAQMTEDEILHVLSTIQNEARLLEKEYAWVQVFENKGEMMGSSNPHPHCQIWASDEIPYILKLEDRHQLKYFNMKQSKLLADYRDMECRNTERVIVENDQWVVLVPFWAVWPYETLVLPKYEVSRFGVIDMSALKEFAKIMQKLLLAYDRLFQTSFPYSMGFHGSFEKANDSHWLFHTHYYPPLLRSATIRKYLVGYEMLAEAQRDITPEQAAQTLRLHVQ